MTGYVRVDTSNNIADGNVINAADLDNEFDGVQSAFNASTGHTHGGGVGQGAPITTIGPTNDVTVGGSLMAPKISNTVDIGSSSLKFKDLHLAGNATIDGVLNSPTLVAPVLGTPQSGNFSTGTFTWPTFNQNTTGTAANVTGTVAVANGGTGATSLTANNVILGNGTAAVQVVAPGTTGNVLTSNGTTWQSSTPAAGFSTSADNTFTGTQSFTGTSAKLAMVLNDAAEVATVSATAATGTINYDITTQSVLFYTSNASANWTVNFRASSGTSLNTALATGQSVTVAFLVTQGATAYYNNVVQVDGTASGVTTRWLGGAPTAGNASGIDSYRYLIIKTGSATYTVLASVTQFRA
jgi:hypothetical protein